MALVIKVNGVTLPHRVRLNDGTNNGIDGLTSAADGSGSMGGIIIDDPNHDLVLQGWQTVVIEESDCTTAPRLFTGFIGDRTTTHGNYPTDGGRQVNVTLYDQNVLLSWALITGADGKRPVESRTARIDWLLDSPYLDTIVFDTGFVVPSGASDFDEADYRGQYPRDVLDDVLGAFQVAFAFWDEAADKVGLFYDAMTAVTRTSTLTISNDPADQDFSTCWPPYVDAELAQDPSNVYSLERLTYTNGLLLDTDPTTKATFFPSPYPNRGQATDRSRIGKLLTAQHYMAALLEQASAEDETVTCTLLLPSTHVGLVDAGQRISVKFVHLDGYEDFVYTRITSRTTRQALGRSDLYEVQLTLNQRGPFGGGGGGGGSNPPPTTFPPGTGTVDIVQTGCGSSLGGVINVEFPNPVTIGSTIVVAATWRDGFTTTTADTNNPGTPNNVTFTVVDRVTLNGNPTTDAVMLYRVVTADDLAAGPGNKYTFTGGAGTGRPQSLGWELAGATAPSASVSIDNGSGTSFSFPSLAISGAGMVIGFAGLGSDIPSPATMTPEDHFYLQDTGNFWQTLIGMDQARTGAGSQVYSATFTVAGGSSDHDGIVAFFPAAAGGGAPAPGQENARPEVATMTGANGTTLWPFANGTLKVFVDDTDQTGAITAQDGAAGTFTLGFTPFVGEVVTVEYVGR